MRAGCARGAREVRARCARDARDFLRQRCATDTRQMQTNMLRGDEALELHLRGVRQPQAQRIEQRWVGGGSAADSMHMLLTHLRHVSQRARVHREDKRCWFVLCMLICVGSW